MIETVPCQPTLAIRLRCTPDEMSARVHEALSRVRDRMEAAGASAAGPPYTRYLAHDAMAGLFELEVGVPLESAMAGADEFVASELPGGHVAQLWHAGTYSTLGQSFAKLGQLVSEQRLQAAGAPWEAYVIGPPNEPDASKWRTVLRQPLATASSV